MYQMITLLGNVGGDAEMRYTPSGTAVTNFSVAVSKRMKGKDGEKADKTTWFRVAVWAQMAESLTPYLLKGQQVLVEGELEEPRIYEDRKSGENKVSLEVTAREIRLVGKRSEGQGGGSETATTSESVSDEDIPF